MLLRVLKQSNLWLFCFIVKANIINCQVNLVVDPSFEIHDTCNNNQEIYGTKNWHALDSSNNTPFSSSSCTPAYFNKCCISCVTSVPSNLYTGQNFQYPRTGAGMYAMEFYLLPSVNPVYNRDYLRGRVRQLINGKQYCGKFYVNLFNTQYYAVDRFGAHLDNGALDANNECLPIITIPTWENPTFNYISDTLGWKKIEGTFIANGTESYITIGNFYNDINTHKIVFNSSSLRFGESYYYIDDVSIIPLDITAWAGNDATICLSDTLSIGRPQEVGLECMWYTPSSSVPFSTISNFTFKPTETGVYTFIQKMDNCQISFDTVTVTVIDDCNSLLNIPNVFTPNGDGVNEVFKFELKNATLKSFTIYDRWGLQMYRFPEALEGNVYIKWDGRTTSGVECTAGVYFYVLEYTDVNGDTHKKNGYVTLIR